jgi:hypothetical protein
MQAVEKPNFFPKTAAFESKPAAPAAPAAAAKVGGEGEGGKEKKAPPVVTVVTSGDLARAARRVFVAWCNRRSSEDKSRLAPEQLQVRRNCRRRRRRR